MDYVSCLEVAYIYVLYLERYIQMMSSLNIMSQLVNQ